MATYRAPVAETVAVAKRDLKPGEKIDALGGFTVYGMIERADVARSKNLAPLGLVVGASVEKPLKQGQTICYSDLALDESQTIVRLRREQDRMLGF